MPRPKRNKVASAPLASKQAILRKTATNVAEQIDDSDDNGGEIMKVTKPAVNSQKTASDRREMAGMDREHSRALEGGKQRRDAAMGRLEAENVDTAAESSIDQASSATSRSTSSSPVEIGRRERAAPVVGSSSFEIGTFKKRARQPSILGRGNKRQRSSSVESNLADRNGLTNLPPMGNTILAIGGARRRQRQPSILGGTARRVRSSSVGLEMDIGTPGNASSATRESTIGRRGRQSSILGASKNSTQVDRCEDEEDDFNPEDESTPLNISKTKTASEHASNSTSPALNPRKRKLSPPQAPRSSPPLPIDHGIEASDAESLPGLEARISSPAPQVSTPEPPSETMAPPRSSSSVSRSPSPVLRGRRNNIQPRVTPATASTRRQPLRGVRNDDPPSSPPSLTHSPNRLLTAKRQPKAKPLPASFSTAQLQALLPRRRRRLVQDTFDIQSSDEEVDLSGLASDDDELTHLTVAANRTSRRTPAPNRRVTKLKSAAKGAGKKTYGTKPTTSDKENGQGSDGEEEIDVDAEVEEGDSLAPIEDDMPENSQELEARVGKELKLAKRKFEDVDKWEMEFEDMTGASSDPWDAR